MPSDSPREEVNARELTSAVYEVSCLDQTFDLKGWMETSNIDHSNIELILQNRSTDVYYSIPYEWLDSRYWHAKFDVNRWEITKGTWDFYVQYGEKNVRIKVEEDVADNVQMLHKQSTESQKLWMYQTKKGALSIKSSSAFIQMDELVFSKDTENSWNVRLQGMTSDSLLENAENKDCMVMVVKNRHTDQETKFPGTIDRQKHQSIICTDVHYQDLLVDKDMLKQTWDCYLTLADGGDTHLVRMTWTGTASLKQESGIQVEENPIYQLYFDVTVKHNVIIKRTELSVQNNVENIAFHQQHLHIKGLACLDAINPDTNKRMKRYVVVKRKKDQERLRVPLPNNPMSENHPYSFAASIPLKQLFKLGHDGAVCPSSFLRNRPVC